jgi:hypothetical protein
MNESSTSCKITRRLLFYGFVVVLVSSVLHWYLLVRKERVCTRLSMRMATGEHEVFAALPPGHYFIHFTSEPSVGVALFGSDHNLLPAVITAQLTRKDGSVIAGPSTREIVSFDIEDSDAFRPLRLLVNITKKEECTIYMDMAPSK